MADSTRRDMEFELWWLIHQTTHLMARARDKELKGQRLLIIHAGILFAVQALDNRATPAELARWLAREPHTISGIITGMVKRGLVEKGKDLDRRNLVRVSLTDKGRRAYNKVAQRVSVHDIMTCLSEAERQQLWGCMEKLRARALARLGTGNKPPSLPFAQASTS